MINIPLLRKAVEWVEEQDQLTENREWHQASWFSWGPTLTNAYEDTAFCDTAFCVAGFIAVQDGWTPDTYVTENQRGQSVVYPLTSCSKDGTRSTPDEIAQQLLGINDWDAARLFDGENTASMIRTIAEDIAGERL